MGVCQTNQVENQKMAEGILQRGLFLAQGQILFDAQQIEFPLTTSKAKIVDAKGRRVKIAGANWSGGHAERHCVGGLQYRKIQDMCKQIKRDFDMNCIRLTFSIQMWRDNNIIDKELIKANPQFYGKRARQIFKQTVKEITEAGLMVILNNHTSKSQWCCSNSDGDGLWYNQEYPEEQFQECLLYFARQYKNNPRVIGMDLRNQIRYANGHFPSWGSGDPKTDWKMQAEKIGNKILQIAPHWLIFVGGISYQLDLTGALEHPVKLTKQSQLVYTGHFYSFSWPAYHYGGYWNFVTYEQFKQKMIAQQVFVRNIGVAYYLGEYGNNQRDVGWEYLMRFLKQMDIDWTYWCLDGYKCKDKQDEAYGIWDYYFQKPRHPQLLRDMKKVGRPRRVGYI